MNIKTILTGAYSDKMVVHVLAANIMFRLIMLIAFVCDKLTK